MRDEVQTPYLQYEACALQPCVGAVPYTQTTFRRSNELMSTVICTNALPARNMLFLCYDRYHLEELHMKWVITVLVRVLWRHEQSLCTTSRWRGHSFVPAVLGSVDK